MGAEVLAGRSVRAVAVIHMREDAILKEGGNGKRKEKCVPSRDTESARLGNTSQVGMKAREVRTVQVPRESTATEDLILESEAWIDETCPRPHSQASAWTPALCLNMQLKLSGAGSRRHHFLWPPTL